jgi:hypothetical protein
MNDKVRWQVLLSHPFQALLFTLPRPREGCFAGAPGSRASFLLLAPSRQLFEALASGILNYDSKRSRHQVPCYLANAQSTGHNQGRASATSSLIHSWQSPLLVRSLMVNGLEDSGLY